MNCIGVKREGITTPELVEAKVGMVLPTYAFDRTFGELSRAAQATAT